MPDDAYTPMPLPVLAALRHLSGEEFKLVGALCYYTYTQSIAQVTVEQLQAFSGVSRQQVKPLLHRLIHRGWVVPDAVGGFYRLALQPPSPLALESITYDTALGIRPPRPKSHLLYPEGPWLTEAGLLNEDFVRDRAQVWRTGDTYQAKAFGAMAIEDVMGAVCKHYAKPDHHVNLEIDWQSYCLKNQRYLANVQQRLQSGAVIQPQEQATVLKKLPILQQQTLPLYEPASTPLLPEPNLEAPVQPIEVNWKALLPDRSMPSSQPRERLPEVDQLRLWLADPILRQEAEQRALSRGYNLVYSEAGVAIDILESA
jgi:hypothetical protein